MNLITDPWLRTDQGALSPSDALLRSFAPAWGRGDWDAATRVLLIALLQTAIAKTTKLCANESAWGSLLNTPPGNLEEWLLPLAPAFSGDVFEMPVDEGADRVPVSVLLPEAPGENAVHKNSDIAVWRDVVPSSLSEEQVRISLYSDALWGTRWGRGHRQGTRGESRMLTLVEPENDGSLWQSVWHNVLPANRWATRFGTSEKCPFPWKMPLRATASPQDSDPLEVYWAMPRRLRTLRDGARVVAMLRQSGGIDYAGWRHPLTPYRVGAEKKPVGVTIKPGHIGYGEWVGIATLSGPEGSSPATVVSEFIERRWDGGSLRLRTVGWALIDSASPGAFVEQTVPFMPAVDTALVKSMLDCAKKQSARLDRALRLVNINSLGDRLYAETESEWYTRLRQGDAGDWEKLVYRFAVRLFDAATDLRGDIGAVMAARSKL